MAVSFFHGVETRTIDVGSRPIRTLNQGTIAIVGTAPMHLVAEGDQSLNDVILVNTRAQGVQLFGPDQAGYSIPQALDGMFDQVIFGSAVKMAVVNVLDATTALTRTPDTQTQVVTDGKLDIAGTISGGPNLDVTNPTGGSLGGPITYVEGTDYTVDKGNGIITILPDGGMTEGESIDLTYTLLTGGNYDFRVNENNTFGADDTIQLAPGLRDVTIQDSGNTTTYVEDTDYVVNYQTGLITRLVTGTIAVEEQVNIDYEFVDPQTVSDADIIGATGQDRTGMQAWVDCFNLYGFTPRILTAPFYSDRVAVSTAMETVADEMDSMIVIDVPLGTKFNDVIAGRGPNGTINLNTSSARVVALYPHLEIFRNVTEQNELEPASIRFSGVWANRVEQRGFWWSPSNVEYNSIVGTEINLEYIPGNPNTEVNDLNAAGVTTYVNYWGNGIRTFGNRSLAFPSSSNPDNFINIKFAQIVIYDSIRLWAMQFLDYPINDALIDAIIESGNAYLRNIITQGGLLDGSRIYYDPQDNPAEQLADGQITFRLQMLPSPPAERIVFLSYLDINLASNLNVGRELVG